MNSVSLKYADHIHSILDHVIKTQYAPIDLASSKIAEAIIAKRGIFVFGASHASIIAQELTYRTGGLVTINPILPPSLMLNVRPITHTSAMERLEGYGVQIMNSSPMKSGDVLLIHSVSGRNSVAIDLALEAKKNGIYIICLTNLSYSHQVSSRHSSGKRLFECSDIIIDNCGDFEDSSMDISGLNQKVAPTSTVIGATIVNMMVIQVVEKMIASGIEPPVFHSANVDGGDDFNAKILEKYKNQVHYL